MWDNEKRDEGIRAATAEQMIASFINSPHWTQKIDPEWSTFSHKITQKEDGAQRDAQRPYAVVIEELTKAVGGDVQTDVKVWIDTPVRGTDILRIEMKSAVLEKVRQHLKDQRGKMN